MVQLEMPPKKRRHNTTQVVARVCLSIFLGPIAWIAEGVAYAYNALKRRQQKAMADSNTEEEENPPEEEEPQRTWYALGLKVFRFWLLLWTFHLLNTIDMNHKGVTETTYLSSFTLFVNFVLAVYIIYY